MFRGKLGKDLSIEEGCKSTEVAVLNSLSVIKNKIGSLNKIDKIIKLMGFIASDANLNDQHLALNRASGLLVKVFSEYRKYIRSAI